MRIGADQFSSCIRVPGRNPEEPDFRKNLSMGVESVLRSDLYSAIYYFGSGLEALIQ
jgi:hypothetical protein